MLAYKRLWHSTVWGTSIPLCLLWVSPCDSPPLELFGEDKKAPGTPEAAGAVPSPARCPQGMLRLLCAWTLLAVLCQDVDLACTFLGVKMGQKPYFMDFFFFPYSRRISSHRASTTGETRTWEPALKNFSNNLAAAGGGLWGSAGSAGAGDRCSPRVGARGRSEQPASPSVCSHHSRAPQ